jgi:hypothetical protein
LKASVLFCPSTALEPLNIKAKLGASMTKSLKFCVEAPDQDVVVKLYGTIYMVRYGKADNQASHPEQPILSASGQSTKNLHVIVRQLKSSKIAVLSLKLQPDDLRPIVSMRDGLPWSANYQ